MLVCMSLCLHLDKPRIMPWICSFPTTIEIILSFHLPFIICKSYILMQKWRSFAWRAFSLQINAFRPHTAWMYLWRKWGWCAEKWSFGIFSRRSMSSGRAPLGSGQWGKCQWLQLANEFLKLDWTWVGEQYCRIHCIVVCIRCCT